MRDEEKRQEHFHRGKRQVEAAVNPNLLTRLGTDYVSSSDSLSDPALRKMWVDKNHEYSVTSELSDRKDGVHYD